MTSKKTVDSETTGGSRFQELKKRTTRQIPREDLQIRLTKRCESSLGVRVSGAAWGIRIGSDVPKSEYEVFGVKE